MSARWLSVLTLAVVVVDAVLLATGVISLPVAAGLVVAVELPLAVASVVRLLAAYRRIRRERVESGESAAEARRAAARSVVDGDPLLRVAAGELALFASLGRWIARRPQVPEGARGIGYSKGAMVVPGAFAVAGTVEMVVVHLLVPWQEVRIVLALLGLYGVLFVLGWMGSLVAHPHLVYPDRLVLRHGTSVVGTVDIADIDEARTVRHLATPRDYINVEDDGASVLTLAGPDGTNVRLELRRRSEVTPPTMPWRRGQRREVDRVRLQVDDPQALAEALQQAGEAERTVRS